MLYLLYFLVGFFAWHDCERESFCLGHKGPWNAIARTLESIWLVLAQRQERRDSLSKTGLIYFTSSFAPASFFCDQWRCFWLRPVQTTRVSGATASTGLSYLLSAKHMCTVNTCSYPYYLFSSFLSQIILFISFVWLRISCWTLKMLTVGCRVCDLWRLV